ncbi:hypothetical protein PC9H_000581 [Pleurotus ostreatus]|uniref:F-box domain-containing protein n=1 Tax=Pleurotus ostreatus TaxID=5322 RepID=A0A8H7A518_PLEOS|nr:uncharacterized protein PC9H_000581 [Pleurotus ostreatus]KAF7440237.1 hypothetical protein PC9H_000581 [Pleurotus ostreatus]KAJ8700478.1 hypothetical protein PTI98_003494 [Pleurotus ostreatus]
MLLRLPAELVARIALHLLDSQPFYPPRALNSLRLTCQSLRQLLDSKHFKGKAFGVCFDVGSVGRRNFVADTGMRADQFEVWSRTVRSISEKDVNEDEPGDHAPFTLLTTYPWDIGETFLQAYVMLLSNDGKNIAQLEHAGLYLLLRAYLKKYLYKGELLDKGWPVESLENSCALWLLWMMTTEERLSKESLEEKEELVSMILPWVMVPFRYSSAHAPPSHYTLPLDQHGQSRQRYNLPHTVTTAHGHYPIYGPAVLPAPTSQAIVNLPYTRGNYLDVSYFGTRCIFSAPPPSIAAKLLYFSRRRVGFQIPPHLPATRAEAIRRAQEAWEREQRENGRVIGENGVVWDGRMPIGPTKEDMVDLNAHQSTELPMRSSWYAGWNGLDALTAPPSRWWDNDYYRSRYCYNVFLDNARRGGDVYTPGMLDGLWQGRMLIPSEHILRSILTSPRLPADPNARVEGQPDYLAEVTSALPLIMRLGEYHWLDGSRRRKDRTRLTMQQPLEDRLKALHQEAAEPGGIARCAKKVNRIDEGMGNAWFPHGTDFAVDNDDIHVRSPPSDFVAPMPSQYQIRNVVPSLYEKCHATESNSHDPEHCAKCLKREVKMQTRRRALAAENEKAIAQRLGSDEVERIFESVGLGRTQDSILEMDVDGDEDGEDWKDVDSEDDEDGDEVIQEDDPLIAPPCHGVRDVLIHGSSDLPHALAWHPFVFRGRVRPWDGLVGILRVSKNGAFTDTFFYGYVVGGKNFVGNWRNVGAEMDAGVPAWEGAFSMSKRE